MANLLDVDRLGKGCLLGVVALESDAAREVGDVVRSCRWMVANEKRLGSAHPPNAANGSDALT
jgi:hypothetical protein